MSEVSYERLIECPRLPELSPDYLPDNVYVHFHFSHHVLEEHFEGTQELIERADIIIPEAAGWKAGTLREHNAISRGSSNKYHRALKYAADSGNTYDIPYLNAIYRSHKPILFVDGSYKQLGTTVYEESLDAPISDSVEGMLDDLADLCANMAQESVIRDGLMVSNLGPAVTSLVDREDWGEKEYINVLCTLGYNHRMLYDYFREQPGVGDRVSATVWIGCEEVMSKPSRIAYGYRESKSPDRKALLDILVLSALQNADSRLVNPDGPLYPEYAPLKRTKDETEILGAKLAKLIMQDIEDEQVQVAMHALVVGKYQPRHTRLVEKYITKAMELETLSD